MRRCSYTRLFVSECPYFISVLIEMSYLVDLTVKKGELACQHFRKPSSLLLDIIEPIV